MSSSTTHRLVRVSLAPEALTGQAFPGPLGSPVVTLPPILRSCLTVCLMCSSVLLLAGPSVAMAQTSVPAVEPNEEWWAPFPFPTSGKVTARFDTINDHELFVFQVGGLVQSDIRWEWTAADPNCDMKLHLMGPDAGDWHDRSPSDRLASSDLGESGQILYTLQPGRYHLGMYRDSDCVGADFYITFAPASALVPVADAVTPIVPIGEPNDTRETATGPLTTGVGYRGALETRNDTDWLYMYVQTPGNLVWRGEGSGCGSRGIRMNLYQDGSTDEIARYDMESEYVPGRGVAVNPGKYLIEVASCSLAASRYTIRLDPGGLLGPNAPFIPPPDADGDGVPDASDQCPNQAGPAPAGCPDADGDGVFDAADRCPTRPGPGRPNGCPPRVAYISSISLKRVGRRKFRGKLSTAGSACRSNRRIVLRRVGRGTKKYGSARTNSSGRFTIRARRGTRGRVYAVVSERSTAGSLCRVGKSRSVRAR